MEDFGFNHKPHDTRHTFATRMHNAGADPLCTKIILGHSIKDLTERIYTHKTIEQLIEAVNMLT